MVSGRTTSRKMWKLVPLRYASPWIFLVNKSQHDLAVHSVSVSETGARSNGRVEM